MTFSTVTETRDTHYIFAGNDAVHTATAATSIAVATPALTVLMLDATGNMVAWNGTAAGAAVGVLALALEGTETTLTYYKSGTFVTDALIWPSGVADNIKANAFVGSAISHQ